MATLSIASTPVTSRSLASINVDDSKPALRELRSHCLSADSKEDDSASRSASALATPAAIGERCILSAGLNALASA